MRILHITTFLQGGAGRAIVSLALAQQRAGHGVLVVGDAGGEPGYGNYPEHTATLAAAGIPFHLVTSTFKRDAALNAQAAAHVRDLQPAGGVDLVHAHAAVPGLVARQALAAMRPPPFVHTMHGWGVAKSAEQAGADLAVLAQADALVTPSHAALDALRRLGLGAVPAHVVPYGIAAHAPALPMEPDDAALFKELRASGRRIVLCVGTIGVRKNQALLVEALAHPGLAGADAVFIGEGETALLTDRAAALGVSGRVHVLGYRVAASRYLATADALVLPSRNEGLPLVILEALRAGVPVAATAIPEIAEMIEDCDSGFLAPSDDAGGLAIAVACALAASGDPGFRSRLRRVFAAAYAVDRMTDAYHSLYESVCARNAAAPASDVTAVAAGAGIRA